jgi:hypothetical protein
MKECLSGDVWNPRVMKSDELSNKCIHPSSSEIFVATSLEDSPSSTTFRSTPRSADASEPQRRPENTDNGPNRAKARAGVP